MPFFVFPPAGPLEKLMTAKAYVPLDDEHCMVIALYSKFARAFRTMKNGEIIPGMGTGPNRGAEYLPNTTDWLGRWRLTKNAGNDYMIDREAQRSGGVYSGIVGIQVQDSAIAETMGPITDRTFEHLAASDETIARARRKLVRLVQAYDKDKTTKLPGVDEPQLWRGHRGGYFTAPEGRTFRDIYAEKMSECAGEAPRWAAE
jgi:hypothetical protein